MTAGDGYAVQRGSVLGVDLGMTSMKVARRDGAGHAGLHHWDGHPDLPLAVTRSLTGVRIGRGAYEHILIDPDPQYALDLLSQVGPTAHQDDVATSWSMSDGAETFLRLSAPEPLTGSGGHDQEPSLVVALPESWRHEVTPAPEIVAGLFARAWGQSPRLVSSAEAAAAYLLDRVQVVGDQDPIHTILVCDAGGTTFEATVFDVHGKSLHLLAFESTDPTGVGSCGRAFDMGVARHLASSAIGAHASGSIDILRRALGFEELRRRSPAYLPDLLTEVWDEDIEAKVFPDQLRDPPLQSSDIKRVFEPIADGVRAVIQTVGSATPASSIAVALVGGFSWFPALRWIIEDTLGKRTLDVQWIDGDVTDEERLGAAALGALAVAEGRLDPVPRFPREVYLPTHAVRGGLLEECSLPLGGRGDLEIGAYRTSIVRDAQSGTPLVIEVDARRRFSLQIGSGTDGTTIMRSINQKECPPPGSYRIEFQIHPLGQASLVFRQVEGDQYIVPVQLLS